MPDMEWAGAGSVMRSREAVPVRGRPQQRDDPLELLAAVRHDVPGETLGRITGAMTAPTTSERGDGSTV
jgi:hypothetical protein